MGEDTGHLTSLRTVQDRAIAQHWRKITSCRRCLDDPHVGHYLREQPLFFPMPTTGPLPGASKPVRYLVVAQEPSGSWAGNNALAQQKIEEGFLWFLHSPGDFALQYALEHWSIDTAKESYQLSDLAKCACT